MGKTLIYLLLLLILGAGVYYFIFSNRNDAFSTKEAGFTIRDTSGIHKIFLTRTSGEPILLQRTDSGWMLNGKYKARQAAVTQLLRTVYKQEAKFPVPEQAHDGVVKTLAGASIKVELYGADGSVIRTFYVGNEAHNYVGTYMLLQGAKKPYVVQIPGFDGYLTPVYSTEIADWRSRSVFDAPKEDIESVTVEYPLNPRSSYTLVNQPALKMENDPSVTAGLPLNARRANAYLGFFSNINCEGFINGVPFIDTVIASVPRFCVISLKTKSKGQQKLDVYFMPVNKRSKNQTTPVAEKYDQDRYYGVMNRDTMILQHHTFEKLMRGAEEFYQPDKTADVLGLPRNKQ
ncbi:MAG: DUF4340 domain-containing protein [Sphingobacteriales bacterium]|nr:MAG: DUF4340 domain-containing protein [Sphingobacteriales bacterium]